MGAEMGAAWVRWVHPLIYKDFFLNRGAISGCEFLVVLLRCKMGSAPMFLEMWVRMGGEGLNLVYPSS
jgi:hypothetical protein